MKINELKIPIKPRLLDRHIIMKTTYYIYNQCSILNNIKIIIINGINQPILHKRYKD